MKKDSGFTAGVIARPDPVHSSIDMLRHIFVVAVIGFFFISGYLYKVQPDVFGYARKQAIRLLAPFVFFSLVYTFILTILGKLSIQQGLIQTITLHGAGMQLYFLPYLFIITVGFAFFSKMFPITYRAAYESIIIGAVALISIAFPTSGSTGSDLKLLSLYLLGFLLGKLFKVLSQSETHSRKQLGVVSACLLIGIIDSRFFDVAGIVALFIVVNYFSGKLPSKRLPGSGGIYLLHTPIINFTLSVALVQIGVTQVANVFISVFLTYIFCLAATLVLINKLPKLKWLLLE